MWSVVSFVQKAVLFQLIVFFGFQLNFYHRRSVSAQRFQPGHDFGLLERIISLCIWNGPLLHTHFIHYGNSVFEGFVQRLDFQMCSRQLRDATSLLLVQMCLASHQELLLQIFQQRYLPIMPPDLAVFMFYTNGTPTKCIAVYPNDTYSPVTCSNLINSYFYYCCEL